MKMKKFLAGISVAGALSGATAILENNPVEAAIFCSKARTTYGYAVSCSGSGKVLAVLTCDPPSGSNYTKETTRSVPTSFTISCNVGSQPISLYLFRA